MAELRRIEISAIAAIHLHSQKTFTVPQDPQPKTHLQRIGVKLVIVYFVVGGFVVAAMLVLRAFGLLIPYTIPTAAMSPTINRGDKIIMEGVTFLARAPRRGDVIVFTTDGIESAPQGERWIKRIVGLPGETLRIANGKLYVNNAPTPIVTAEGEMHIASIQAARFMLNEYDSVTVPENRYFVLGDNSPRSLDSRFWGPLAKENIKGLVWTRYWPRGRAGLVK